MERDLRARSVWAQSVTAKRREGRGQESLEITQAESQGQKVVCSCRLDRGRLTQKSGMGITSGWINHLKREVRTAGTLWMSAGRCEGAGANRLVWSAGQVDSTHE